MIGGCWLSLKKHPVLSTKKIIGCAVSSYLGYKEEVRDLETGALFKLLGFDGWLADASRTGHCLKRTPIMSIITSSTLSISVNINY